MAALHCRTALHYAAAHGHKELVSLLIDRKCILDQCDDEHRTALVKAVQYQKEECVRILLDHGADPNISDINGNSALHHAITNSDQSVITELLLHNADLEAANKEGFTPLLFAIIHNKTKLAQFLVGKGANVNAVDIIKRPALLFASSLPTTDILKLLLQHGADYTAEDIFGRTAEQYALSNAKLRSYQVITKYKNEILAREHEEKAKDEKKEKDEEKGKDGKKGKNKDKRMDEKKEKDEEKAKDEKKEKDEEKGKDGKKGKNKDKRMDEKKEKDEEKAKDEKKGKNATEEKKHESSDVKLSENVSHAAKSGKTDDQQFSKSKDSYRIPILPSEAVKESENSSGSPCLTNVKSNNKQSVSVEDRRIETDGVGRWCNFHNTEIKRNRYSSWSSVESLDLDDVKPGSLLSVNAEDRKLQTDDNVTRVSGKPKKSQVEGWSASESAGLTSTKPVVMPVRVNDKRREPHQNVTRFPRSNRKEGKKSACESTVSTEFLPVSNETTGVVLPDKDNSRKHGKDRDAGRDQLRRKEEQYWNEAKEKQQLESKLSAIDMELRSLRSHLMKANLTSKLIGDGLSQTSFGGSGGLMHCHASVGLDEVVRVGLQKSWFMSLGIWRAGHAPGLARDGVTRARKPPPPLQLELARLQIGGAWVSDSNERNEREKRLLPERHTLQDEILVLKLEIDKMKNENQEMKRKYFEDIEIFKEKNDFLEKQIEQSKGTFAERIAKDSEQLLILKRENTLLNSKLENEKRNKERLEAKVESCRCRLDAALHDREQSRTSKRDLELNFQRTSTNWLHLQGEMNSDLSALKDHNELLCQQNLKNRSKIDSLEIELKNTKDALKETTLSLEAAQRDLSQKRREEDVECLYWNEQGTVKEYMRKQESLEESVSKLRSEKMLLQQQLIDIYHKADNKEKIRMTIEGQLQDTIRRLQAESETQEKTKDELIDQYNHLKKRIDQYEREKEPRE
ncbi:Ankyrin repeat domain-containing protein 26, partial [Galemys pyrenaicus]